MLVNKEQIDWLDEAGNPTKKLVVSYIDHDGDVKFLQYVVPQKDMFNWFYAKSNNGADPVWKSFDNKPVKRVPTNNLSEFRINEILNSLGKPVEPIFDYNVPKTWYCDIETDVINEFPDSDSTPTAVNTISLVRFPKAIVWGRKNLSQPEIDKIADKFRNYTAEGSSDAINVIHEYQFEYRGFNNEADMLDDFFHFIKDIPCLSGWNFLKYDWPYLFNRATKKLGMNIDYVSPTGHWWRYNITTKEGAKRDVMLPMHKIISDYMMIFQKWDQTVSVKENFSLDFCSNAVLGFKKVEHHLSFSDYYKNEYLDYVFYNAVDSILVEQMDAKIHTSHIWYNLTAELKTDLMMEFSTIMPTQIVMVNFLYPEHKVLALSGKKKDMDKAEYPGAFVWPTQQGVFKYIGGLDFASLYPTTQRQFLISPENYIGTIGLKNEDGTFKDWNDPEQKAYINNYRKYKLQPDQILCVSGALFRKDKNALMPRILTHYFMARKHSKAQRKQVDKEYECLKKIYDKRATCQSVDEPDSSAFQYADKNIDYATCVLEKFEAELERLKNLSEYFDGKQLSEKKFINSCYGATASRFFIGYNIEVARAITLQGQDLNHFSENCVNRYFSGVFQKDTALHAKLGIDTTRAAQFDMSKGRLFDYGPLPKIPELCHLEGEYSMTVGGDTDSIYVEFGRVAEWCGIPSEKRTEFTAELWNNGCGKYLDDCYDAYSKHYNCFENLEVLELEKICRTTLYVGKKHYVMEETWEEPGVFLDSMSHIIYKGLEVVQGGTPAYARKCMKNFYEYVLQSYIDNKKPSYQDLIDVLKKYKSEMEVQPVEDICQGKGITDYEKYVLQDDDKVVLALKTPIHTRSAAMYNHALLQNRKYLQKYSRIRSGDKLKYYYTKGESEVFGFLPYNYPIEFAPPIDYDQMFEKTILNPLNKIVSMLGYNQLSSNLMYASALF